MKEGWTYKKLGEVAKVQNGFAFKSSLFREDGSPIVRISSIQNGEIKEDDLVTFYPSDYDVNFDNYKIFPNDILIAMSGGTTGKLGINKTSKVFYQNQRVGVIRENSQFLNHFYLYYFLHTKTEESLKIAAGAAQPNLSTAQINNFIIPVPPLSEQQRIVAQLDEAFAEIDMIKAEAEKQLSEAKALFQKALSQAMTPKEGWEKKKLGEVCDFQGGSQPPKSEWIKSPKDGYVRMLQIRDFTKSRKAEAEYVKLSNKLRLCKSDDILIGRYGASVGKILTGLEGAYNVAIIKSIPVETIVKKEYIRRFFESATFQEILLKVCSSRTAQAGFSKDDIQDTTIPLPPLSEQQRIVEELDELSENVKEIETLNNKLTAECDAMKQALLRQVFE